MNLLIVDFEFSVFTSHGRPRFFFPEIIEVGAVVIKPPYQEQELAYRRRPIHGRGIYVN